MGAGISQWHNQGSRAVPEAARDPRRDLGERDHRRECAKAEARKVGEAVQAAIAAGGGPVSAPWYNVALPIVSIKEPLWVDVTLHLPSRLAWIMHEVSLRSKKCYLKLETMAELGVMGADERWYPASAAEVEHALRTITETWRLFKWDRIARAYVRVLKPGESSKAFKTRVQRTIFVEVAICWVLRDLVEYVKDGVVYFRKKAAAHTNAEFAKQLGCSERSIERRMNAALATGCFRRYNRRQNKPLYVRFDDPANEYLMKYREDPRTAQASGVNPYVEPNDDVQTRALEPNQGSPYLVGETPNVAAISSG